MKRSRTLGILLLFSLCYLIAYVVMIRSYTDQQQIDYLIHENKVLNDRNDQLITENRNKEKLNDIMKGRLIEVTKLATGRLDKAIEDYDKTYKELFSTED